MSFSKFFFSVTLTASSSFKSSSTKGGVLEGGGVSLNVTLSDSSTFLVCLLRVMYALLFWEFLKKTPLYDFGSNFVSDNENGRNGNGNHGDGGNNGNRNPNENGRGVMPVARICTYQDFVKFQPPNFKGTEEVVGLTRWFEKMETVFHIINFGVDVAFSMTWRDLMKLMTEVYCLRNEIQKMEIELWNLTMKNNDLVTYTQRFQELTLLCTRMVPGEEDRMERYVGGLPNNIQGNVMSAEPTRLQDAIRLANSLMDQKWKGYAIRSAENKRKFESNQRDNCVQQPPFKRQNIRGSNVAGAYTGGGNEGRVYVGPHPLCNKCKLHHIRPCTVKCRSCGKIGHMTKDCKLVVPMAVNQRALNQNHGDKPVIPEARGKEYTISGGDANPGSKIVTDVSYAIELADRRIAETNNMLRGLASE
ncbi:putative reverse transcriptase domain, ribonuclease H-like domain protein [Tanacetum coccineum]